MPDFDEIIHQPIRLRIMATLASLIDTVSDLAPKGISFTDLKEITGASDGNLGAHLTALEKAGYVEIIKRFVGKRPETRVIATDAGRASFAAHVQALKAIIEP